jgi:hypothetical protein
MALFKTKEQQEAISNQITPSTFTDPVRLYKESKFAPYQIKTDQELMEIMKNNTKIVKTFSTKEAEGCIGDCEYPENINDLLRGYTNPEDIYKTLE